MVGGVAYCYLCIVLCDVVLVFGWVVLMLVCLRVVLDG